MREKSRWMIVGLVAVSIAACGSSGEDPWGLGWSAKGDAKQEAADKAEWAAFMDPNSEIHKQLDCEFDFESLPVQSIDKPSQSFDFCSDPIHAADSKLNLTNAAWLAYFAAMEYGHLAVINPEFMKLGFGADYDAEWTERAINLRHLRRLEGVPKRSCGREAEGASTESCLPPELESGAQLLQWANDKEKECYKRLPDGGWQLDFVAEWLDAQIAQMGSPEPSRGISAAYQQHFIGVPNEQNLIRYFSGEEFYLEENGEYLEMEEGSTQMVWAEHRDKNVVIVAFRGTEPNRIRDIIADAKFRKKPLSQQASGRRWGWKDETWGNAHRGFLQAYGSVARQLDAVLNRLLTGDKTRNVWVTGHSLGGALATLFAAKLLELKELNKKHPDHYNNNFNLKGLYTFGSPRVGDDKFRKRMQQAAAEQGVALMRFKHGTDIVTRVPKWNYEHVGQTVQLERLDEKDEARGKTNPPKVYDENMGEQDSDTDIIGNAGDHSMDLYFARTKETLHHYPRGSKYNKCASQQ